MRNIKMRFIWVLLFNLSFIFAQFGQSQLDVELIQSQNEINLGGSMEIALKVNIHDGWHINSNNPKDEFLIATTVTLKSDVFKLTNIRFPKSEDIKFEFSEKPISVFEGEIYIYATLVAPDKIELGDQKLEIELGYQSCNNLSCMPPDSKINTIAFTVVDKNKNVEKINSEIFSKNTAESGAEKVVKSTENNEDDEDSLADTLESSGLFLSLILVFLGGLALNLTPCVYPLIPITVGYFGGQSEGRTSKLFVLGLFYVIGMAITYSVVGVVTSLSGAAFGSLMQQPLVIVFISLIFVALALSMFGLYEFKMPDKWVMKAGGARSGNFGAFFMGLTMGIVAAPCIGPFLLGLVTAVAAKGDPLYGFMMFFVLALGLGTPYLFLAIFSGKIKSLPKAGFWMNAVKRIFGYLLIGMALWFANPLFPKEIGHYVLPVFGILVAIALLFIDKLANDVKGFRIFKIVFSIVVLFVSIYSLWPTEKISPDWIKFEEAKFEQSLKNNHKIMIDFYADWCIPCKEFDSMTFSNSEVVKISKEFDNYKVDMTKSNKKNDMLRKKFGVKGMPTIIFFNKQGKEVKRLTGFVDANEFVKIMKKVN